MKKNLYLAAIAAGALAATTSCSNDDVQPAGDGNVSIRVSLPEELDSRAFGDGTTATQLTYAVYEKGTQTPLQICPVGDGTFATVGHASFTNLTATVNLQLANTVAYDIVFWADAPGKNYYSFDAASQTITVDYEGIAVNDDSRDAFFNAISLEPVTGAISETVELRRPFAQVNIGTSDLEAAKRAGMDIDNMTVGVTVPSTYSALNLMTGEASEEINDVEFAATSIPGKGGKAEEEFPYEPTKYNYLTMNYLLVPAEKMTTDISLNLNGKAYASYSNVPVQRNYQTNIFGALLTNPAEFNVIIKPAFDGQHNHEILQVSTPEELAAAFENPGVAEIMITSDLDLSQMTATGDDPDTFVLPCAKTITLANNAKLTLDPKQGIETNYDLTINGGTITNDVPGVPTTPNSDGTVALIRARGGNLTINGTTIINDQDWHKHGNNIFNASAVSYWNVESVTIVGATIKSGGFTLCGMGRGNNNAVVTLNNSTFESNSSNSHGQWAYSLRVFGSTGSAENCIVNGVQGGLSVEEIEFTIKSGIYTTQNTPGKNDAFYPLYVTNGGKAIVEGGYFWSPTSRSPLCEGTSAIVAGDNDTGLPEGSVVLKGGYMSGKAYNHVTNQVYEPAEVYEYKEVNAEANGLTYKWEVVKK